MLQAYMHQPYKVIKNSLHIKDPRFRPSLSEKCSRGSQSRANLIQQLQGELMDVDLSNKYKASPSEVQNIQAKRQRQDSEGGKGESQGNGNQQGMQDNSRTSQGSGQKGNRGKGRARGRGKGG